MSSTPTLRLGTRGSLLARTQSQLVASELEALHPGLAVELIIVKTSGDIIQDKPLHDAGGKGLFTKELEQALLAGEVDFAVHSFKDVPVTMPLVDTAELVIAAVPPREDARDVLAFRELPAGQTPPSLKDLPAGANVGTGSLRRRCQLLHLRPDLNIQPIRGNIDTRLRKLDEGQHDAVVLAMAGLRRTRLYDESRMRALEPDEMLPASGQGALALQCRSNDSRTRELLKAMHDVDTDLCVKAEREMVNLLGGDCHSPIAALANLKGETLKLRAVVGARDGGVPVLFADASGARANWREVVQQCHAALEKQDVRKVLHG